jgi:hypothetical protein
MRLPDRPGEETGKGYFRAAKEEQRFFNSS